MCALARRGRRSLEQLGFNPGRFPRCARLSRGRRGAYGRTEDNAGLRRTYRRPIRQAGNMSAVFGALASSGPLNAAPRLAPSGAAATALASLAAAPTACCFGGPQRNEFFKDWGEQRERKNPHPRRSDRTAEKAEDERVRPQFADRDQDASIPKRKRTPVLPRNRQLIRLCGGTKRAVDAAGGHRRRTARRHRVRKRKGAGRFGSWAPPAGMTAGPDGPRSSCQSPTGNNRHRTTGWQTPGRRAAWHAISYSSTCRGHGSRKNSIHQRRRRQAAQGRRPKVGEPCMQRRRCARFEGSERSPTYPWSHYTMRKRES